MAGSLSHRSRPTLLRSYPRHRPTGPVRSHLDTFSHRDLASTALATQPRAALLSPAPRRLSRRRFLASAAGTLAALACAPRPGAAAELTELTLREAADALRAGRASAEDLTRACLARIDRAQPGINAFITVAGDAALADARARDAESRAGRWRGPL